MNQPAHECEHGHLATACGGCNWRQIHALHAEYLERREARRARVTQLRRPAPAAPTRRRYR